MKKILETFKSLYTCEDSGKTHLTLALMFLLPSLLGASIQFLDKDFAEFQTSVIIMALIFAALSIIPILFLIGYYLRFVNQRLSGEKGIPTIDWGSVTRGAKAIPLYLVWALYVAIPFLVYFFILVAVFGGLFFSRWGKYTIFDFIIFHFNGWSFPCFNSGIYNHPFYYGSIFYVL